MGDERDVLTRGHGRRSLDHRSSGAGRVSGRVHLDVVGPGRKFQRAGHGQGLEVGQGRLAVDEHVDRRVRNAVDDSDTGHVGGRRGGGATPQQQGACRHQSCRAKRGDETVHLGRSSRRGCPYVSSLVTTARPRADAPDMIRTELGGLLPARTFIPTDVQLGRSSRATFVSGSAVVSHSREVRLWMLAPRRETTYRSNCEFHSRSNRRPRSRSVGGPRRRPTPGDRRPHPRAT